MEQKYIEYELVPGTKIVVKVDVGSCIDDMELADPSVNLDRTSGSLQDFFVQRTSTEHLFTVSENLAEAIGFDQGIAPLIPVSSKTV